MFSIASIIFFIFTILYAGFSAAIIYHLKQYTIPQHYAPRIVVPFFLAVSGILWLMSLLFLFRFPS